MKLTKAFFHGQNHIVTEENGMLTPYRFSQDRLAYYANEDEILGARANNSSSISIEFTTSEDLFTLDVAFSNEVRNENSLTVYEDGHLAQIIGFTWDEPKTQIIYRKKNSQKLGKECHYAIYLPTMATASVQNLSAEDATPTPQRTKLLLALGDSITQGVYTQASAHAYPTRLARRFGLEVCNQAVGGYYFNANAFVKDADPSIITLAYGINDLSRTNSDAVQILKDAEICIQKIAALYPNIPVFCITPIWRADFMPEQLPAYDALTEGLLALCEQYGLYAINGRDTFPHDAGLFTDGYLHPSDDGFAIMERLFADAFMAAGVV